MDATFSNSTPMAGPQVDWLTMVMQMENPVSPVTVKSPSLIPSLSPSPPTSPIFNTHQLSPPPFFGTEAATETLFSPRDHLHLPVGQVPIAAMREMIFRIAAMQPVHIDPEAIKPPIRRNVKISKDPQSVAARHRREKISEKIRILQRIVPGGTKMDTASMLDEAIQYVKFLKSQVQSLERATTGGWSGEVALAPSAASYNHCFGVHNGYPQAVSGAGFAGYVQRF